jgi:hypothetical protein
MAADIIEEQPVKVQLFVDMQTVGKLHSAQGRNEILSCVWYRDVAEFKREWTLNIETLTRDVVKEGHSFAYRGISGCREPRRSC